MSLLQKVDPEFVVIFGLLHPRKCPNAFREPESFQKCQDVGSCWMMLPDVVVLLNSKKTAVFSELCCWIMSLKRAKSANDTITNAVFGFIREHEKKQSVMAPALIKDTFTFIGDNSAMSIKLTEGNTVAELEPCYCERGIYGNMEVDIADESISEYVWTLQFIERQSITIWNLYYWKIGLADIGKSDIEFGMYIRPDRSHVARIIVGGISKRSKQIPSLDPHAKEYVVQMRLDIIGKKLSFVVNGASAVILQGSNALDTFLLRKSKLCVRFGYGTKMVKLLDFSIRQR